jgi:hypothetical protein
MSKFMGWVMLLAWVSAAAAQAERLLQLPDGGTLRYSSDWVILTESGTFENNRIKMESDLRELTIWIYFTPRGNLRSAGVSSLLEFAEYDYNLYEAAKTQPFDPNRAILRRIDGVQIAEYTFQNPDPDLPFDVTLLYRLTPTGDGISLDATSYYDLEVGDISSLYAMLTSYEPPEAALAEPSCEVRVPGGVILRAAPSISALAVRTTARPSGEILLATLIRVDSAGAEWYRVDAPSEAYVRAIIADPQSAGCVLLPRTR